jgi:serine/threonine protein kinase
MEKRSESYTKIEDLALGSFANIFLATEIISNKEVAIKCVKVDLENRNDMIAIHELEIFEYISANSHPCLLAMKCYFIEDAAALNKANLYFVMESFPCDFRMLCKEYNSSKELVPILDVKMYAHQILNALVHLSMLGIRHRFDINFVCFSNLISMLSVR